jgi:hypothetical protein
MSRDGIADQTDRSQVPHDLIKALEKRAKEERRPLAAMIRLILQDEVRRDARRRMRAAGPSHVPATPTP